jgi:hypothetical protein
VDQHVTDRGIRLAGDRYGHDRQRRLDGHSGDLLDLLDSAVERLRGKRECAVGLVLFDADQ